MNRRLRWGVLGVLLVACGSVPASAQFLSFDADQPRTVQALMAGYYLVDFTYDGDVEPAYTVNFSEPAFGLIYTRPSFMLTAGIGNQKAGQQEGSVVVADTVDLRLVDLSLSTWGELYVLPDLLGHTQLFIPILLHSDYRRVAPRDSDSSLDAFNVTVLGLGAGVGLGQSIGELVFEARVTPIFGITTSSFGDALGNAQLVEADVQLHTGRIAGRVGLSVGYSFRAQRWNVNASNLFAEFTEDLFDYTGRTHLFRAGINW